MLTWIYANSLTELQQVSTGRNRTHSNTPISYQIDQEQNSWELLRACFIGLIAFTSDEEEGHKDDEIKLLSHAFISSDYKPKDVDRIIGLYVFDKPNNDTDAEQRTDTLCIPYVRGASDRLRKQLAKEGVNVVFRKGQTLGKYLMNGGPPKNNRRKNVVYKIPCDTCSFCYIGETSQWFDEREVQHKRSMKNCDTNNGIYMHILKHPDHVIAWEKATILDYDRNYYAR